MIDTSKAFSRGQITWAIWGLFTNDLPRITVEKIPTKFKARIKNLLELDWTKDLPRNAEGYAFGSDIPSGSGNDVGYMPRDVFCLAIAMDLVDSSLKPSDVVLFLRYIRKRLVAEYERISEIKPNFEIDLLAKDKPELPSYSNKGKLYVDFRSFLVVRNLVVKEAFKLLKGHRDAVFLEPTFCQGLDALHEEQKAFGYHYRKAVVVELSRTVQLINEFLPLAPELKKGWQ